MLFLTRWFGVTGTAAERDLDAEPACIKEIVEKVLLLQSNAANGQHRPLARGTHAKGVSAGAQFEVFDVTVGNDPTLARHLARGIFAKPGLYPAVVRFANSDPRVQSDYEPDVRSLSMSVDLTCGGTVDPADGVLQQDFSLQSAPTLPLNDASAFLATMKVLTAASPTSSLLSLPLRDKLRVVRSLALARVQMRRPRKAYQQLRYWSTVPFRHGDDVVKQSLIPFADNPSHALHRGSPNALRHELIRHLNEDATMSIFEFGLQFLDSNQMTYWGKRRDADFWIENASVRWPEAQAPFHMVARLTLLPRSQLSDEASAATYYDVTAHALPDSKPIGSINRARWPAEVASRQARMSTESKGKTEAPSLALRE
jgi:hypothetical protein